MKQFSFSKKSGSGGFKFKSSSAENHDETQTVDSAEATGVTEREDAPRFSFARSNATSVEKLPTGLTEAEFDAAYERCKSHNHVPRFSFARSNASAKPKSSPFAVEKKPTDLTEAEYDAAFGAMPVPYSSVSVALDFSVTFSGAQLTPTDNWGQARDLMVRALLELSRAPGAWRDAVVGSELVWAPGGPLGQRVWDLNAAESGVLLQSVHHYSERRVALKRFITKRLCEAFVMNASTLQHLSLMGKFDAQDVIPLQALPLTSIHVERLTTELAPEIAKFDGLSELRVGDAGSSTVDFSALSPLGRTVEKLSLPMVINDGMITMMPHFKNLRELDITRASSSYFSSSPGLGLISCLPSLPHLEALQLGSVTPDMADDLRQLRNLRKFVCHGAPISKTIARALASLPRLEWLGFNAAGVMGHFRGAGDEFALQDLEPLAGVLKRLHLGGIQCTSLENVPMMPMVRELRVPTLDCLRGAKLKEWASLKVIEAGSLAEAHLQGFTEAHQNGELSLPSSLKRMRVGCALFFRVGQAEDRAIAACLPATVQVEWVGGS